MLVDKKHWLAFHYQIKEVLNLNPEKVLLIGKGSNYDVVGEMLKSKGINVTTFDINHEFQPDVIGSVEHLSLHFPLKEFDVVLCAEVLEHLPFVYFKDVLYQMKKVSKKYVVITLPHNDMIFSVGIDFPLFHDKFLNIGIRHKKHLDGGVHCWEINSNKQTSLVEVRNKIKKHFDIIKEYRYPDFPYIRLWVLKVRSGGDEK